MKIQKYIKKGKDKYNIILDNNVTLTLNEEVIIKNNLLVNKEITKDKLNSLLYQNDIENIYSKCIKYITVRIRSKKEMVNYINKITNDENILKKIINKLEDNNYINDNMFARCYVNDKVNLTNYGPNKIRYELRNHNIDENIIEKNISEIDEKLLIDKINKIIKKDIQNNNKYSKNMFISKLTVKLITLGYDKNMINSELNNYEFNQNNDIIKRDYEKILNKLKQKNEGNELILKVKQKLLQKGYSFEEINQIVNL